MCVYLVSVGDGEYDRVEFLQLFQVVYSHVSQFNTTSVGEGMLA